MANLKHIGRIRTNKRRAIVAYRTLPGDPYSALVVLTEALPADEHDSLIKLVESPAGQQAEELAIAMSRSYLPDGRNMLAGFHATGQLKKVATSDIEMIPNSTTTILLSELNQLIAKQRGVALEDLAVKDPNAPRKSEPKVQVVDEMPYDIPSSAHSVSEPVEDISPDQLAKQLRSTADAMFKEAQKLRAKAEEIAPTKKKAKVESAD